MKKVVFMFVAIAAISFASCGNSTKKQAAEADTVLTDTVDTTIVDTVATVNMDTTVAK